MHCVCAGHGRAEALDGREDLFREVPVCVWLKRRGGSRDFGRGIGAFCCGFVGSGLCCVGGGGGHYVGDHVVDTNWFAGCEGAQGNLDLRHGVGVGVVLGVFTEFLIG